MRLALSFTAAAFVVACATVSTTAVMQSNGAGSNYSDRAQVPIQTGDMYYQTAETAVLNRVSEDFAPRAKNVIIFVGDGMGISTITAGRIYAGQKRGLDGESFKLAMETLPHMALSRTYSHDFQVSDSSSTATAMVAGVKTRSGVVGVTHEVPRGNCASALGQGTDTLFELAERQGLATGIISTARITHATPASTYAESANRNWEDDTSFGNADRTGCADIASQLIDWPEGDGFEVAMGGGRQHFLTVEMTDPEYEDWTGRRLDMRDLTGAWRSKSEAHEVVFTGEEFAAIDFDSDTRVLGLFEPSHMQYELDRGEEPSIADLTRAAITRLSRDEDGYVLMVEGGRIDHAHHGVNASRALEDTDAFDLAVAAAMEMTDIEDTLIIVTADHSHTMTMAGYPRRNNPILGKVKYPTGAVARGADGKPYTTLAYANGESACRRLESGATNCTRLDISDVDTTEKDYLQQSLVFMGSETHGGEDVAIFAQGPGADLVRGVMDQNEIFHVMGFSSGLVAARPSLADVSTE
ncbi:MAG: alkaline phosphatase [Pseudomonadota bacterium]